MITRPTTPRSRADPDDEVAAALVERFPGAVFDRVARPAGRLRRPRGARRRRARSCATSSSSRCASTSPRSTICSTASAPCRAGVARRALRGRRQLPVAPAQPPHPRRSAQVPGRRPDGRRALTASIPGVELRRARDLRPVRHRRSTGIPTSRASSCPTTGSATRCARTTPPRACPGHVQGRPEPAMSDTAATTTIRRGRASSARPTRARRSCARSPARRTTRGRAHRRRHVARRARRHDDHQHGSAAPVDPRRAAAS